MASACLSGSPSGINQSIAPVVFGRWGGLNPYVSIPSDFSICRRSENGTPMNREGHAGTDSLQMHQSRCMLTTSCKEEVL